MKLFKRFKKTDLNEDVKEVDEVKDDGDYIINTIDYKPVTMTSELQRRKEQEELRKRYNIGASSFLE